MEVPATRPEVTTSGIYGEELGQLRQRLLRSDLSYCGDLTARTQALIVGRITPGGSRKLVVARARRLPCVSSTWVTDGACSLDATEAFDIRHELSGKEVCTTSLNHVERGRVEAVCAARGATYNALLTRLCGVLVAPSSALAFASPSASSPATANDKIRFARKHGIWTMSLEEFGLRYSVEALPRREVLLARGDSGSRGADLRTRATTLEREDRQPSSLKCSSGLSEGSSHARIEAPLEARANTKGNDAGCSGLPGSINARDVLAPASVRGTSLPGRSAASTPRPSATVMAHETFKTSAPSRLGMEDSWRSSAGVAMSAIQPTLPSQLTAIAATGVSVGPSQLLRVLGDEFSDVVAYCSPPHYLTIEQHDLLSGMGVTVMPHLSPFTTHVLVLGETVEECIFPRPGLQIVSWQWVMQSRLEQRRLSCAGFRVQLDFCPVITFTGLSASDKHELMAALRHSGLPCEVQEALVLGGGSCSGGRGTNALTSDRPSSRPPHSFLPRSTTHLVALRRQLLASQKVAVLAQHCQQQQQQQQHTRRRPSSPLSSASACRLVGVDWVYRSIQQGQWLEPEPFALTIPHPEAFTLAAAHNARAGERVPGHRALAGSAVHTPFERGSAPSPPVRRPSTSQPSLSSPLPPGLAAGQLSSLPPPPSLSRSLRSPSRGEVVLAEPHVEDEDGEEEEEGAAHSQHNTTGEAVMAQRDHAAAAAAVPTPPSLLPAAVVNRDDEEDEEAGGESPLATAARHSALQALHLSQQPPPSPQQSQAERQALSSPSSGKHGSSNCGDVPAPEPTAHTLQLTGNGAVSHTFLGTQNSPTFENLLGELEAYPSGGILGGVLPYSVLGAPARPPAPAAAASLSGQVGGGLRAHEFESVLYSPPESANTLAQQGSVLQRPFLHHQRLSRRPAQQPFPPQQQQHQQSFASGRYLSDESQVIFYQMGLRENGASSLASQGSSQSGSQPCKVNGHTASCTTIPTTSSTAKAGSAAARASMPSARGAKDSATDATARSATTAAVFLVTKDVIKGSEFDWDAFAARFPHFRRTSKPEECTHFITSKPSKTEQFLCCMAAGHWILHPTYLGACTAAGYLVKEEAFEWSAEMAAAMDCRSSVATLVRGCRVQREATELPFARWQVKVCCSTTARADSFVRVLRNGGCMALQCVSAKEVLDMAKTEAGPLLAESPTAESKMVLADDTVFTEEEVESYAQRVSACRLCPLLRLDYLVQFLCAPGALPTEADLLTTGHARKRTRTETSSNH